MSQTLAVQSEPATWPSHVPHPFAEIIAVVRAGCAFRGGDVIAVAADGVIVRGLGGRLFSLRIEEIDEAADDETPSDQYPAIPREMRTYSGTAIYHER